MTTKTIVAYVVATMISTPSFSQTSSLAVADDVKPSAPNQPDQEYPQMNSQGYARFRINAPKDVSCGQAQNEVKWGKIREFRVDPFQTVLTNELIPYVDADFRTLDDRSNRAMAGLPMGGMETKTIALNKPDVSGCYGLLGGGLYSLDDMKDRTKPKLIFISCGSRERVGDGPERSGVRCRSGRFREYRSQIPDLASQSARDGSAAV